MASPHIARTQFADTISGQKPTEPIGALSIGSAATPTLEDNTFLNNNENIVHRD